MELGIQLWVSLGTLVVINAQFSPFRESGCKVTSTDWNEDCCENSIIPCGLNEGGCRDDSHCERPLTCQDNACLDGNNMAIPGSKCCAFYWRKPLDSCFEKDISYWYYDISSIADMDSDGCNAACRAIDYCAAAVFVTSNKRCYPKVVAVTATWARRVEVGTNTEHIWCKPNCWIPDMETRHSQTTYHSYDDFGTADDCQRLCQENEDCFTSFVHPFPYRCYLRKFDHYPLREYTNGVTMPQFCITWSGSWGYEEELGPDIEFSVVQAPINRDIAEVCSEKNSIPAVVETPRHQNLFTFMFRYERLRSHKKDLGYKTANNEVFNEDNGHSNWINRGDDTNTSLTKFICQRVKDACHYPLTIKNAYLPTNTKELSTLYWKLGETVP